MLGLTGVLVEVWMAWAEVSCAGGAYLFSGMKMLGNGLKRAKGPSTSQLRAKQGTSVAVNSEPTQQSKPARRDIKCVR